MLTIKLGVTGLAKVAAATVFWLLNTDASAVGGRNYVWLDDSAWADGQKWKDTGFGS